MRKKITVTKELRELRLQEKRQRKLERREQRRLERAGGANKGERDEKDEIIAGEGRGEALTSVRCLSRSSDVLNRPISSAGPRFIESSIRGSMNSIKVFTFFRI